ncbi:unnamed protein product [Closterium sp. NIES-64]|nr:unnamed protein product [Closterium sp. NIES-64]CAI6005885.1 unnamed protein product [Closterium sp. NIES-65]
MPISFQISWWRAQAIRFLLRWPSLYLCHLTNIARHRAFGRDAAIRITEAGFAQAVTEDGLSSFDSALASPSFDNRRANETLVHDMAMQDWLGEELFVPRPMLHMHVRQGDKIQLGKAESVATWMRAAMLLRVHDPSLHRIQSKKKTETRDLRASVESSLVNLMLAAECDYSVTTLDSNWNRVIHSMRITGGRANSPVIVLTNGVW